MMQSHRRKTIVNALVWFALLSPASAQNPNDSCNDPVPFQPTTAGERTVVVSGSTFNNTVGPYLGNCAPVRTNVAPTAFYTFTGSGRRVKLSTCADETDFGTAITMATGCGTGSCFAASKCGRRLYHQRQCSFLYLRYGPW